MAVVLAITALIILGGVAKSVEKITKVMMCILFVLMVSLAIYSCTLDGAEKGLSFYLKPDFSKMVDKGIFSVIYDAMGQAFFTLSLGIGAMTIFGSYIDKKRTLPGESVRIILLDTAVALLITQSHQQDQLCSFYHFQKYSQRWLEADSGEQSSS